MLFQQKASHPYIPSLVEGTIVALPHRFSKLLSAESGVILAGWEFAFCTAQVQELITVIISNTFVTGNLQQWGEVSNLCNICFPQFCRWLHTLHCKANWRSSMRAGRTFRWRIRAGRSWPIDWIVSLRFWTHFQWMWKWWPLSLKLWRGEHLRPTITTLVEVISLPLWPITSKSFVYAGGWFWDACHIVWRMVMHQWSTWKLLWWRGVTIPMHWMILIDVYPKFMVFANGSLGSIFQWSWVVLKSSIKAC